jgi:hypothetical protein
MRVFGSLNADGAPRPEGRIRKRKLRLETEIYNRGRVLMKLGAILFLSGLVIGLIAGSWPVLAWAFPSILRV